MIDRYWGIPAVRDWSMSASVRYVGDGNRSSRFRLAL